MDLFVSSFLNKIDKKGRVSLPSIFRNVLANSKKNEIILFKSIQSPSIEGCSITRLDEIASRISNLDFFSEDYDDFSMSVFSEVIPTNLDKEGRFQISEDLKNYANIKNEVLFFGQGLFFQIWEPEAGILKRQNSKNRLLKQKKSLRMILTQNKNK